MAAPCDAELQLMSEDNRGDWAFPEWVVKLIRRLMPLPPGRYMIVLDVGKQKSYWSVTHLGKIEHN